MSTSNEATQTALLPATVGGGHMGAGIAHAFLFHGSKVTVVERDEDSARSARERVAASAAASFERGAVAGDRSELLDRFSTSIDYPEFPSCDLVV